MRIHKPRLKREIEEKGRVYISINSFEDFVFIKDKYSYRLEKQTEILTGGKMSYIILQDKNIDVLIEKARAILK